MAKSVTQNYGSCIDFDLVFRDIDGVVEDISDDEFSVFDADPVALQSAVLTKAEPGTLHFHLPAEAAILLGKGDVNRLRIMRTFPDGCTDATDLFGIDIK